MLTTVQGIYDNGRLLLEEEVSSKRARVIVTFLDDIEPVLSKRKSGSMKGKIMISDDFNDPLEDFKDYM